MPKGRTELKFEHSWSDHEEGTWQLVTIAIRPDGHRLGPQMTNVSFSLVVDGVVSPVGPSDFQDQFGKDGREALEKIAEECLRSKFAPRTEQENFPE